MAIWLVFVLAALVLAVIGATTAATWLLVIGIVLLGVGLLWAGSARRSRSTTVAAENREAVR